MGIDKSNVRWVIHCNVANQLKFMDDASPERRELLTAKLERMKQYAEALSCRRRILFSYFGETPETDCRHCEVWENPSQTFDGGYASVAYDKGLTLQMTDLSLPILKGENTVPLVKFRSFEEKKAAAGEGDPELFDHLRAVRKKLADEHEVPAYVIFSEKTLKDMAAKSWVSARPNSNPTGRSSCARLGEGRESALTEAIHDYMLDHMTSTVSSLKAHLSENLRRVAGGESVVVTDRRKPVARIIPYEVDDPVESVPTGPFLPVSPNLASYPNIDTMALLVAERGEH